MASEEPCANPLLLGWVKEWVDLARERNSKGITTYKHAYNALKACPITFNHPSQLQQLKGFGPKLCDRLTEKLEKHCQENGLPVPKRPRQWRIPGLNGDNETNDDVEPRPAKKPRKQRRYVPTLRSGAYALILGLTTIGEEAPVGMTKAQLIEAAQPHCDASFTAPSDPTRFYTAWNSMKTLLEKDLVYERGRPLRRYALSDEGWEVARRVQTTAGMTPSELAAQQRRDIQPDIPPPDVPQPPVQQPNTQRPDTQQDFAQKYNAPQMNMRQLDIPRISLPPPPARSPSVEIQETGPPPPARSPSVEIQETGPLPQSSYVDVVANGDSTSDDSTLPTFRPIRLAPGTFTVHLVLDVREIRARTDRDYMQEELTKKGVKPIMRSLELGDALWVAKCHDPNFLSRTGCEGDEVVLDWIVERKRLDDLIYSIKDGRFHEQKFRLKRSGVKNVVYIVEEMAMDSVFQKYEEAVQSAIASTQVVNGYFVKKTQKMDDTIRYLTRMTMLLKEQYESKSLLVIPTEVLTARNFLPLLQHLREKEPSMGHYISYPAFASMASKSDMMTLRDVYLKMLMCTKQVTGEKALEIQKTWKTPYEFAKAFEKCGTGEEGKKRKQDMVFGQMGQLVGRKKVARTLSHKIAEIWGGV